MDDNISQELQSALKQARPANLHGNIMLLTPGNVARLLVKRSSKWKPGYFRPRCEFNFDITKGSKQMHILKWGWKDQGLNKVEKWTTGIYQGGVNFPGQCASCMRPSTHNEIVQLTVEKKGLVKVELHGPDMTNEKAELMFEGYGDDRYWFPVPFCDEHGIKSKTVDFKHKESERYLIGFTNKEYGQLFGKANKLRGGWFDKSRIIKVRILVPLSMFIGIPAALFGGIFSWRGITGVFGKSVRTVWDLPAGIPMFAAGLFLVIYFTRYYLKNRCGEDMGCL